MHTRTLGRTDIHVSTVCLGCWALVGGYTWGEQDREASRKTVRAALDAGITFFDTAEAYGDGESERLLGEELAPVRDRVVLASKVSRHHLAPDALKAACEASLKALGTDYLDLYQVHWPSREVPLADTFGAMQTLRAEGKIREIGVSNFGASVLGPAADLATLASNQVCHNLLFRPVEVEVQPLCVSRGISLLPYSPLAQGLLTGKFRSAEDVPEERARTRMFSKDRPEARHQEPGCEAALFEAVAKVRAIAEDLGAPMGQVALAWLLAQDGVASVLAGARTPAQVRENAAAADLVLEPDAVAALADATDAVKAYAGTNIDLWQTDSRADP